MPDVPLAVVISCFDHVDVDVLHKGQFLVAVTGSGKMVIGGSGLGEAKPGTGRPKTNVHPYSSFS